jgi:hypothetical protein
MATVQAQGGLGSDSLYDEQWTGIATSGDVGTPVTVPAHIQNLSFAVVGTFTGSLAVQLQGSPDNTNYVQLKDISGTAVSLTANGIVYLSNMPKYIKPVATAGTGGAAVNAFLHGMMIV